VIARVEVEPNGRVGPGQAVLTFEDVKVRNEMQQALERVQVAKAKIDRSTSAAFGDKDQARDIATLRAEYDAARADYNYARELMAKSQIKAPVGGLAIYSDRRDWEGRAVNVGDPILQIADPRAVSYRIELPVKEQLALEPGAPVRLWLDAQPLWALDGQVAHASYQARPTADGTLSFVVTAKPDGTIPSIGSRGTAKLYGDYMPFIYTLLRRPIASLRQFVGL
jgi:multidrug resistance efflux pump